MFQRFHEMRERGERGFTLIELLVVILIIAILAAIAIPVFLNQRKKGWVSQMESALKNAATAQESFLTTNDAYSSDVAELEGEGLRYSDAVTFVSVAGSGADSYVMTVSHTDHEDCYTYDSDVGKPEVTACAP